MRLNPSKCLFLEANQELYETEACLGHVAAAPCSPEVQAAGQQQPLAIPVCMPPGDFCPSHGFIQSSNLLPSCWG